MDKAQMTGLEYCRSHPLNAQNIPDILKDLSRWVVWKAFDEKPDGRFDKVPICPLSGRKINHLDKVNQRPFEQAIKAHHGGSSDGIGIVLTGEAVTYDDFDEPLYLIGVDLDKVQQDNEKLSAAKTITKSIGSYAEISPSGTGIRIFALSNELVGKGQSPKGEMYNTGRFLTVTGHGPKRKVVTATDQLKDIERQWWPKKLITTSASSISRSSHANYPDTPRRRAELAAILKYISADCSYDRYRDVVWAILSTNWHDAEELARSWCLAAPSRFDDNSFELIVRSHNLAHERPVTIGSLVYWARQAGWHG